MCIRVNATDYIRPIPTGNYTGPTFATALQTVLNSIVANIFTVSFNAQQNNLNISVVGSTTFKIYTDIESGTSFNTTQTIIKILHNEDGTSKTYTRASSYTSGFLELISIRKIYLHSPNLSSYTTYGGKGESNIIKKIPVSSDFGYLIIDNFINSRLVRL